MSVGGSPRAVVSAAAVTPPAPHVTLYKIEYLIDPGDHTSGCWHYVWPAQSLEEAQAYALRGLSAARILFGAAGFNIQGVGGPMHLGFVLRD